MPIILKKKWDFSFYHPMHLGDCIYFLHFLRKLKERYPEANVEFYFDEEYTKELELWSSEGIKLIPGKPERKVYNVQECWEKHKFIINSNIRPSNVPQFDQYDLMYIHLFDFISRTVLGVDPVVSSMWLDHPAIPHETPLTQHWDYLVVNSFPRSGQVNGTKDEITDLFDRKISKMLENGKSVVTTNFNNRNVPCTLDYKMSLLDIAALAASVDCVYGINTAPYIVAINKWSVPNVKKWVHLNDKHTYAGLNIVSFKTKEELDNAVGLE